MSLITDTWQQLVRRRLWPIAVLLLGALVAVPMLLAKSPAAAPPLPAPAQTGEASKPVGGGLEAQPVVDVADTASRGTRHVLGARKDPFAPAPQPKAKTAKAPVVKSVSTPGPTGTSITSPSGGSTPPPVSLGPTTTVGGSTPPVTTGPVPPTVTTPSAPHKRKLAPGTLTVRFGDASADSLTSLTVRKLDALPDADTPVAIYVGTGHGGRTAKFLVDSTVKPEGDGRCLPSPADCQTVELRAGETEFFTVTDDSSDTTDSSATAGGQFELDLVRIAGRSKKAKAARAHHARATGARTARAGRTVARVVRLLHP